MRFLIHFCFLSLLTLPITLLHGQGSQVEFGKNRVQYHDDFKEWMQYESVNFITYFYGEGRNIAQSVVQMAELDHEEVQSILEHRTNDKIELIVYTDLTDLKQSNIGSEEAFMNTGGQTKIVGNKIFVYFNGDHTHLRQQIREGVASVYLNMMLFGANLQEIVQNAVMMNLPEWFKLGLVSYVGQDWDTELDNQLRDIIRSKKYKNFSRFAEDNPKLAGHAMWYFIRQNYGKSTVSNLLYLTRINRSVESGFLYVLGTSYGRTSENWMEYFEERYKLEEDYMTRPEGRKLKVRNKRKLPLTQLKISPDGKRIAYVANEIGRYKVYMQDIRTGDRKVIYKAGFRNPFQATDYNYPLLAWSPNNMELAVLYEKRDVPKLLIYDTNSKEKRTEDLSTQYQRVYSMDFVNPNQMVFSAAVRGFSDIFLYQVNTRQTERLTNDFYDDLDATVVSIRNKKGIIFASNREDSLVQQLRLDTILPINTFDLFYFDLENRSNELVRLTNTPFANERSPVGVDSTYFSFLTDESGIFNRRYGYLEDYLHHYDQIIYLHDGSTIVMHQDSSLTSLDSTLIDSIVLDPIIKQRSINHFASNYRRNIVSQHTAPKSGKIIQSIYEDGIYSFFVMDSRPDSVISPIATRFHEQRLTMAGGSLSRRSTSSNPNTVTPDEGEEETPIFVVPEIDNEEPEEIVIEEEEPEEDNTTIDDIAISEPDTGKIDIDNYLFQSEFDDTEVPAQVVVEEDDEGVTITRPPEEDIVLSDPTVLRPLPTNKVIRFRPARITPYRLKFRTDFVTTQLDNSLLFGGLDSYAGTREAYSYPPPGILLKANFKDLFEDYQFEMGIRIPVRFNGAEYFILFDDKKKRLDKRYAVYRRNLRFGLDNGQPVPGLAKETIFLTQMEVRYPLDIFTSIRGSATLRFDKSFLLATDRNSLETPTLDQQRFGLRVEYVFDNTLDVAPNIKNGTRYKFYVEVLKKFQIDILDEFSFDLNDGVMTVIGLDARHYQRLGKHSILAVRVAGATSFGSEKILYFLGGVDNWLLQRFNNEIPFPAQDDFAFQTLASNLRGFRYNIRNGNSFALMNTELRVPIFKYFSRRIRSSFFRNFQLIGFFDMGTAWQGPTPFSQESPLNTVFLENPPTVNVKVNYFRDPIVAGYGFGVRTMLFGYFIRLDYAWGIETRVVQDPRFYFSLGMDF